MITCKIELSGGLETLFGDSKEHSLQVEPENGQATLGDVIISARDKLLTERPELFMKNRSVRPGILVLINDTDWELTGQLQTIVEDGDTVTFISTLHGG
ncbi:g6313 [Coccomyxa viridis]|uniref:Ubiquitin-related modifier 1 homolog n=1 Tax=Coccomyxa viridis TaxID=1274662 RepID=A0ABP1FWD9_9CHLO